MVYIVYYMNEILDTMTYDAQFSEIIGIMRLHSSHIIFLATVTFL